MGIIKPTCSPPTHPTPPPPPRDITAATRESVIVPSLPAPSVLCRPDLFASFATRDRRDGRTSCPSEKGGAGDERARKGRTRTSSNQSETGGTGKRGKPSERANRGNPSSFWCKASKSLQDPAPTARDRRPGKPGYRGERVWGVGPLLRRTSSRATSEARSRHRGAAAPPPPLRVVSLKGDQLMENE